MVWKSSTRSNLKHHLSDKIIINKKSKTMDYEIAFKIIKDIVTDIRDSDIEDSLFTYKNICRLIVKLMESFEAKII